MTMTDDQIAKGNELLREYETGKANSYVFGSFEWEYFVGDGYHTSYDAMRPVWDKWKEDESNLKPEGRSEGIYYFIKICGLWHSAKSPLELFTALVAAVEWLNGVKQQSAGESPKEPSSLSQE